jgi:hypothetical protein
MKYPNIAVQFDDFDETYDVIEQLKPYLYKEMASFKNVDDAKAYAATKAKEKDLGKVVLKTRRK